MSSSSDEQFESVPEFVTDYHFEDENGEPICFSSLPIKWNLKESSGDRKKEIYVHGTYDNGLQLIYKPVTAWELDLSGLEPVISVLWKDNNWFKLQKPRKSYEYMIRSTLVTVKFLHIVNKDPDISEDLLWDRLSNTFSLFEVRPSKNDLIDHIELIEEAFKIDESLAKSKLMITLLEERPQKKKVINEDIPSFIADDECDREEESFAVCVICDNGGDVISCGVCMRAFHATSGASGAEGCETLGLSKRELDATPNFYCKNCLHKQHQCFSCGELGSSDKNLGAAEVFQCGTCDSFYHPGCLAKLLHPNNEQTAEELRKNVASGGEFTCPCHRCYVCKQMEDAANSDLQYAVCRRCPKSYHRKCLPRGICFENTDEVAQRAWEGILPNNRILIYCLKHRIVPELGTPIRNHIKFPCGEDEKNKVPLEQSSFQTSAAKKRKRLVQGANQQKQVLFEYDEQIETSSPSEQEDLGEDSKQQLGPLKPKKVQAKNITRRTIQKQKSVMKTDDQLSITEEEEVSLGNQLHEQFFKQSDSVKRSKLASELEPVKMINTDINQPEDLLNELGADSISRIDDLMKDAESSITSKDIHEKYNKLTPVRAHSNRTCLETITLAKVEDFEKAIEAASEKLDKGGTVEEAMTICGPNVLEQILKWKNKLRVSLAPFYHGMRHTSFGRQFTKVDKLKEIVDLLHCYVQNGDTVVDFSCGANDFSCLMKDKLEDTGKKCSYRNFDIFRPKNDFAFERRDWISVQMEELPTGSQLVLGLNPPFGSKGALANKFIDKALEFNPKLLILIAPRDLKRLNEKRPSYDLIWEDYEILSGKSFYLPGSVENDKQTDDWIVPSPVLYLWSRSDFTAKHKEIASEFGHLSDNRVMVESHSDHLVNRQSFKDILEVADMEMDNDHQQIAEPEELKMRSPLNSKDQVQSSQQNEITGTIIHATSINTSLASKKKSKKKRQYKGTSQARDISRISNGHDRYINNYDVDPRRSSQNLFQGQPQYAHPSPAPNPGSFSLDSYYSLRYGEPSPPIRRSALDLIHAYGDHPQSGFVESPGYRHRSGYNMSPPRFINDSIPRRFGPESEDHYFQRPPPLVWQEGIQRPFDDPLPASYAREAESFVDRRASYDREMHYGQAGIQRHSYADPQLTSYTGEASSFVHHEAHNREMHGGHNRLDAQLREYELRYGNGGALDMPTMRRCDYRPDEFNSHVRVADLSQSGSSSRGVGIFGNDRPPDPRGMQMGSTQMPHRSSSRQRSGEWIYD